MKTMVKELSPGGKITEFFVCSSKSIRFTRAGARYLDLKLSDASGRVSAKMWDASDSDVDSFEAHSIVKVQAFVTTNPYGDTELKVEKIRVAGGEDEIDLAELLAASPRDVAEMERELAEIRLTITNASLGALIDEILGDADMYRMFCEAPAAKGFHHNYLHGLLEHTVSVCRVAGAIADEYPEDVNRDLLVTAALLHDIGKVVEFEYKTAIDYSDQGRLLGHIVLGEKIVSDAIGRLDSFPKEIELQLLHLILSHHGAKEYGSPVRPKTLESFILNHADDIDAKANVFMRLKAEADGSGEAWSQFNRVLDRFLYLRNAED